MFNLSLLKMYKPKLLLITVQGQFENCVNIIGHLIDWLVYMFFVRAQSREIRSGLDLTNFLHISCFLRFPWDSLKPVFLFKLDKVRHAVNVINFQ